MPALPGRKLRGRDNDQKIASQHRHGFRRRHSATLAQNTNSSTTVRPRTTAPTNTNKAAEPQKPADSQKSTDVQQPTTTQPTARKTETKPKVATAETPGSQSVIAAFNALINGIRHADVKAVTTHLFKLAAPDPLQQQRHRHQGLGATAQESREFLSRRERCEARRARSFDHDARSRRRGGELSLDAIANLQRRARDCDWPHDSGFQTRRQRLESNSPAHFSRPRRSVTRTAVRADSHHDTDAGSRLVTQARSGQTAIALVVKGVYCPTPSA